jgi:hypothetical protein
VNLRHTFLIVLVLVSGCYRVVGVNVEQLPNGRLSIAATERSWSFSKPCVEQVHLFRTVSEQRVELWGIVSTDAERCAASFTYPDVPIGYALVAPSNATAELRVGDQLEVEVRGTAFDGSTRFVKL